jgi:hypothetical protein
MGGYVACTGGVKNAHKFLIVNLKLKRKFWRPRRRWENNIKMDRKEIGCKGVDSIYLAQDSVQ